MRRACTGFGTMWFQSSHISHMTEKKMIERVTERRRKQRGEKGLTPKQTAAQLQTHSGYIF